MTESTATPSGARDFQIIFVIGAIILLIYGVVFLLVPGLQFDISQDPGVPKNPGWVRWSGGLLIGLAVTNWLVSSNPQGQGAYVTGIAIAATLAALAILYSTLSGEYQGVAWVAWTPIAINAVLAALYWWMRVKYKDVL